MIIAKLKQLLHQQRVMSMFDLMTALNVKPEMLRDMLNLLERKGQIRRCLKTSNCGTKCNKCSTIITEMYEWVDAV